MVKGYVIKEHKNNGQVRYVTHGMTKAVVATPQEAMWFNQHETAVGYMAKCASGVYSIEPIFMIPKEGNDSQNGKDVSKGENVGKEAVEADSENKDG